MPYVITTRALAFGHVNYDPDLPGVGPYKRTGQQAVASLEEARRKAYLAVMGQGWPRTDVAAWDACEERANNVGEAGTIIELPDGVLVEVRPVDWGHLFNLGPLAHDYGHVDEASHEEILEAFNRA